MSMGFDLEKFLLEDEAKITIQELGGAMKHLMERMELLEVILSPKAEDRMFRRPYRITTVDPGTDAQVYRQEVPPGFVGVITRIGNSWFPNTFLVRSVDNVALEPRIERSIAPVTDPMPTKVFVRKEVVWRAVNNDGAPHDFEVLTDGFFIPAKIGERIMELE